MPKRSRLFLALAHLGAASSAAADTLVVDSNLDLSGDDGVCSLREALENANTDSNSGRTAAGECAAGSGADVIELPAGQTISLASTLTISSDVSLIGNGARIERSGSCNLDGVADAGEFRLISAPNGGDTISLSDFTLANGCADGSGSANLGGALHSFTNLVSLESMRFENNRAAGNGGAIAAFSEGSSALSIRNSVLTSNTAGAQGGAIYSNSVSPQIEDSQFSDNSATDGGAFHHRYGNPTLERCSFSGNSASARGGAVSFRRHPFATTQQMAINRSTLSGNSAGNGGGVYSAGSLSVQNSTISGNNASKGGGVYLSTIGALAMADSSLIDNSGTGGSQIYWSEDINVDVRRSLLVGASPACNTASTYASGSDNLTTDASCTVVGATQVDRDALQLQPLALRGGSTATHALGVGSAAIDTGGSTCSGSDQRGETRPFGSACDIGAFEVTETLASGGDFVVNALGDDGDGFCGAASGGCTLRDAVLAANSDVNSSSISFDPALFSGVNTLTLASGQLRISAPLTLTGPGSDRLTIDANGASRHFDIQRPSFPGTPFLATLSDLRLINGVISGDGGGSIKSFESTVLRNLILENNQSAQAGGAIWVQVDNASGGEVRLEAVTAENNRAVFGGGGADLSIAGSDGQIRVSDSLFVANQANASGGGLRITGNDETIEISNSEFRGNVTSSSGSMTGAGLVASLQDSTATIQNSRFLDNRTEIGDGSGAGLGIIVDGGSLEMSDLTVSGNSASGTIYTGGGLYLSTSKDGTAVLRRSEVSGNHSDGSAGGIRASLYDSSSVSIDSSTISGNSAAGDGGGVWSYLYAADTRLSLTNTTVSGNQAAASGGGLFAYPYVDGPQIAVDGVTVTNNEAGTGVGGGLSFESRNHGSVVLQGSVVAGNRNTAGGAADWFHGGQTRTLSNSLIGDNSGAALSEAQSPDGNNNLIGSASGGGVIDPRLSSLAGFGGTTQTHRPQPGSPLIDHYSGCTGNDQRGQPRGGGGDGNGSSSASECDIGAVAFQYSAHVVSNETASTGEDSEVLALPNLLANETDADSGDDYTPSFIITAVNGSVSSIGSDIEVANGLWNVGSDGSASFRPAASLQSLKAGETAVSSLNYSVSDGLSNATGTVSVTVNGANDAPVAVDDRYALAGGTVLSRDAAQGLLANDSDIDGDTLSVVAGSYAASGVGGTLTLSADGSFQFNAPATSGSASVDYTLSDGTTTRTSTVTFEIDQPTLDLSIDISDGRGVVLPDEQLTYSVTVANAGPSAAVGARVQSSLPAELSNASWSCRVGSAASGTACGSANGSGGIDQSVDLGVGGSLIFELSARVSTDFETGLIHNSASVTAPVGSVDSNAANNSASDETAANPAIDLVVSKSDGRALASARDMLIYTITVSNQGPANAAGVRVQDTLPAELGNASWSCEAVMPGLKTACGATNGSGDIDEQVNIAAGDSVVFELMTTVTDSFTSGAIRNTASASAPDNRVETQPLDNSATDVTAANQVFSSGFEEQVVSLSFGKRAARLNTTEIERRLPLDLGYKPQLIARASDANGSADFLLVYGRRIDQRIEIQLNRFERGEWLRGDWHSVDDASIWLNW